MAENKTKPTNVPVEAFLNTVEPTGRREDGFAVLEFMQRVTGMPPVMWGPSMIGFGHFAYTYATGRTGETFICGFSPRKANLTLYFMPGCDTYRALINDLGDVKTSAACIYVKRLSGIHLPALEKLTRACMAYMRDAPPAMR